MTRPTIDIHAHILDPEAIRLMQREIPSVAPVLTPIDDDFADLAVAGTHYRPFPRGGWDLERRLQDMARYGFDRQVVAVCPQTVLYDQDPSLTLTASQIQNDQISSLVRVRPDQFRGLATVPMQSPELAAAELRRAMVEGGLSGAMIGSSTRAAASISSMGVWKLCVCASAAACAAGFSSLIQPVSTAVM
jgi:aminocarboxymuconate-semialdehyde decarboxylase